MKVYNRLDSIPPYLFAQLDQLRNEMTSKGYDLIDISIGDPDLPTPQFIIDSLCEGVKDIKNFRYPPYEGTFEFRESVSNYYKRHFGVYIDPSSEAIALIGSKEGIVHLSLAAVDRNDIALVPEPGYPVYKSSVCMAGGQPHIIPLTEDSGFMPQLDDIDRDTAEKTKIIYINYPNNPTGAVCSIDILKSIVEFAHKYDIIICNDIAYNEIVFDGIKPVSIMCIDGARDVAVELGTLSKSYNMTGWRIGYAVGNKDILKMIMKMKSNSDSGQFGAIQHAASCALDYGDSYIENLRNIYEQRRNNALAKLRSIGIEPVIPKGSFYIWFKVPQCCSSGEYAAKLAMKCGVIVTPGKAFGAYGEGYCRIALTVDEKIFNNAIERWRQSNIVY